MKLNLSRLYYLTEEILYEKFDLGLSLISKIFSNVLKIIAI